MLQAAQNAVSVQKLSNKVRILVHELGKPYTSKSEVIHKTYIKSGCTISQDGNRVCSQTSAQPFFNFFQQNFAKNIYGLFHMAEVGGEDTVRAVKALEDGQEGVLKPATFRGAENLIPPDVRRLLGSGEFYFTTAGT